MRVGIGLLAYELYVQSKKNMEGEDPTQEDEVISFLWEMTENLVTEKNAALELIDAQKKRLAFYYHRHEMMTAIIQKMQNGDGTTTVSKEELMKVLATEQA
jgi:hypothetical protein